MHISDNLILPKKSVIMMRGVTGMVRLAAFLKVILITLVLAAIWGVSCASLFEIQTSTREVIIGNQTSIVEDKVLVFNEKAFDDLPITSILSAIVGAAASILAIVFAISNLIVSNISERYTPHILKVYEEEAPTRRTLLSFVLVTALSMILLFLYRFIPSAVSFMLLVSTITGFVITLILLIDYFFYMFKILNPLKFSDVLKNKTLQFVENQSEKEVQDYIMSLGDVAARTFERKEVRVCTHYIKVLYDIFKGYIALRVQWPEKYKLVSEFGSTEKRNCVPLYILDEYFRIFRYSVLGKEEIVSKEVVTNLFEILYESLFAEENDDLVIRLIETRNIFGAKYYQFYRLAIEKKDPSRFRLVRNLVDVLAMNLVKKEKMKDNHLEEFIGSHIFRINQLIIDHDDFDLFRREINNFSLMLPVSPPDDVQNRIIGSLFRDVPFILYRDKKFMEELLKRRAHIEYLVEHESAKNFKSARALEKNLEDYKNFLIGHLEKLQDANYVKSLLHEGELGQLQTLMKMPQTYAPEISKTIEDMEGRAYELYVTSQICRAFFLIGAYLLFKKKEKGIDSEVYVKELWSHTNPDDADGINLNRPPITSNPFWLTYLRLYGGGGSSFWITFLRFGDFHGATEYVDKYYLLAIEKEKSNLKAPSTSKLEKLKMSNLISELGHWFSFSNDFSSLARARNMIDCCDSLIEEAATFNRLLSTKSKNEKGEIQITGAKEKLESLRSWITTKAEEFERTKKEIINLLPLDPKRTESCEEKISKAYEEASEIDEVGQVIEFVQERDKDLEFIQVYRNLLVPKDCLTEPSSVDCSTIWFDLGRSVAFGEINYFIKRILKRKAIKRIAVEDSSIEGLYGKIEAVVNDLKGKRFSPSTIFIPIEYLGDLEMRKYVTHEEGRSFFRVGEDKMKIIHSSKLTPFNDILIIDKNASIWKYKPGEHASKRLDITVQEHEEDKSSAKVLVRTTVNLKIQNPKAVKILRLTSRKSGGGNQK